jgi:hypothetical protein
MARLLFSLIALISLQAQAATIWTDWTDFTVGANGGGSAVGNVFGVDVSYSGELDAGVGNGTGNIWNPSATFVGGTSTTSPDDVGDYIRINGSYTGTGTINFASPVVDPLIAIWSLGQPGFGASFTFNATPALQAGGPNSQYGGSSITVSSNTVNGNEGNGVVQFTGTYSSITFTSTPEEWYAFTVGVNDVVAPPIPEPASVVLAFAGLTGLFVARRFRRR